MRSSKVSSKTITNRFAPGRSALFTDRLPLDTVFSRRVGTDIDLPDDLLARFTKMALSDNSALVRPGPGLHVTAPTVKRRIELARPLLSHAEDAKDHNLPSLIWTALIPLADSDPRVPAILSACRMPEVVSLIVRRLAEDIDSQPLPLETALLSSRRPAERGSLRRSRGPGRCAEGWHKRAKAGKLGHVPGQPQRSDRSRAASSVELECAVRRRASVEEVKRLALDEKADLGAQKRLFETLIENRPTDLRSICERLARVRYLNVVAVRGLALFDDPKIGETLRTTIRTSISRIARLRSRSWFLASQFCQGPSRTGRCWPNSAAT